jgi:anti-sigma factor RsiW
MNDIPTPGAELTCQQLVEIITDYLEGAMPPRERERFELHLAACEGCQHYLGHLRRTIDTLGRMRAQALSDEARAHLLALFSSWKAG